MANKQQRKFYNTTRTQEETVKNSERNARYFKAEYETMYYALEIEKIREPYTELLKNKYPELIKPVEDANTEEQGPEDTV